MHRLTSLLGMPQRRFAPIHVVGTNGKTSVARMTAALLDAHGFPAGAYLSPHLEDWRERIVIGGEPIAADAFEDALEQAEQAAQAADRAAGEDGPVTQFELLTAAAFVALAAARVKVGVIEAGLGGRLDATNVIPSLATVLTSVGLDHTEYLGETIEEIAGEKLAVLRDRSVLIHGRLDPAAEAVAERAAAEHFARTLVVGEVPAGVGEGMPPYQRRNLALALAATQEVDGGDSLGGRRRGPGVAARPGQGSGDRRRAHGRPRRRAQRRRGNGPRRGPAGADRLRREAPCAASRSWMARTPRRSARRSRRCAPRSSAPRSLRLRSQPAAGPAGAHSVRRSCGGCSRSEACRRVPNPSLRAAVGDARDRATKSGLPLLVTGSHFLIGSAVAYAERPDALPFSRMDREARGELLTMMGLVAVVVAVVILVFFGVGYVFGLLFL